MASLNDVLRDFTYDTNLAEPIALKAGTSTALINERDVARLVGEGKIGPTKPLSRNIPPTR